jgi:mRNA interferase HicA
MKRKDILKRLAAIAKSEGFPLVLTEGGRHTKAQIGPHVTYVPRHAEVNELTAQEIVKQAKGEK